MVGKVYIVRHGQGVHNTVRDADENDPLLRDAKLTTRGQQQSVVLGEGVLNLSTVGLVMASPLRRSVHTALLAFSSVLNKRYFLSSEGGVSGGIDLILDPRLQETDAALYNTGSTGEELRAEWRRSNGLAAQPAKRDIVVVSHGGFVQELTGDMNLVIDNGKFKAFSMRMTAGVSGAGLAITLLGTCCEEAFLR